MPNSEERARFEQVVLPHLHAAYNLARWLVRREQDAEDIVQEAYLRAYRFFSGFHGGDARAWLLQIVRNTSYTWLQQNRPQEGNAEFDEEMHSDTQTTMNPETLAIESANRERLTRALEELPPNFREVLVLRELEGCSYKEIAEITGIPIGTVMSSLSRARRRLALVLGSEPKQEAAHGD